MVNKIRVAWLEVESSDMEATGVLIRTLLGALRGVKAVQLSEVDPLPPPPLETERKVVTFLKQLDTSAGPTRIARDALGWRQSNSKLTKLLRDMVKRGVIYSDNGRDFEAVIEEDA